ncbi:classical arabinogalactan protein 4-like [Miscanthus floridulus]|uniref:classical arabinogalactan protein 4-like n=1 Tax=Miscanthus floridulus TaxID=154761 RepID=UPI00345A22AF
MPSSSSLSPPRPDPATHPCEGARECAAWPPPPPASIAAATTPPPGLADAATATLRPGSAGSEAPRRPTPSYPPGAEEAPRAPPSPPPKPGAAVAAAPFGSEAGARKDEDRGPPAWFAALVAVGLYIVVRLNVKAAAGEVGSSAASSAVPSSSASGWAFPVAVGEGCFTGA